MRVLFAWLGQADINGAGFGQAPATTPGPTARALAARSFDSVVLLSNYDPSLSGQCAERLSANASCEVLLERCELADPTALDAVYTAAEKVVRETRERLGPKAEFTYHVSPGTPAMAVIWIVLSRSKHPAALIESSWQGGVRDVHVPFELAAEFRPPIAASDDALLELAEARAPRHPSFRSIVGESAVFREVMWRAEQLALCNVSVLIEGESGTGKELLARAIHCSGLTSTKSLVAINCGAIPSNLVESTFFGHERGAFTGADMRRVGCFEAANGGTLFLDEIGELSLDAQVRLLRVLQEREVTRIGSTAAIPVNVRVIAATNRSLVAEVQQGRFREDLFYRMAVAIISVPPVRKRLGDLNLLINDALRHANDVLDAPGYVPRTISVSARRLLLNYSWPGNVRELRNVISRACLWARSAEVSEEETRSAMQVGHIPSDPLLDRPLGDDFSLADIVAEVHRHYLPRAYEEAKTTKGAAALLGLKSGQVFTNRCVKYGVTVSSDE